MKYRGHTGMHNQCTSHNSWLSAVERYERHCDQALAGRGRQLLKSDKRHCANSVWLTAQCDDTCAEQAARRRDGCYCCRLSKRQDHLAALLGAPWLGGPCLCRSGSASPGETPARPPSTWQQSVAAACRPGQQWTRSLASLLTGGGRDTERRQASAECSLLPIRGGGAG